MMSLMKMVPMRLPVRPPGFPDTLSVDAPGYSSSSSMSALPTYAASALAAPPGAPGVDFTLNAVVTSVEETQPLVPSGYVLEQNYPNPFNPTTQILFSLPNSERVTLTIYNLLGQKIAELVNGLMAAGSHVVTWNGRDSRDCSFRPVSTSTDWSRRISLRRKGC